MPPMLPQEAPSEQDVQETNVALCHILISSANAFFLYLPPSQKSMWKRMVKMMDLTRQAAMCPFAEDDLRDTLLGLFTDGVLSRLRVGPVQLNSPPSDVFAMHIRAQNAAVVVRSRLDVVQFEMFEVSPQASDVKSTKGRLLCSYPGTAVEVPKEIFENECFLQELASYLFQMDIDVLDPAVATTSKAGSTVPEMRERAHPKYICELLASILCAYGQPAEVNRITKRIGDEAPWRRSPLWLVLRVSLQTSLPSISIYKNFMLFFHAHLLKICTQQHLPSESLFVMRAKMARRLSKSDSVMADVHQTVSRAAKKTEELLGRRWTDFQRRATTSPLWRPSNLDFGADVAISLTNAFPSIAKALGSTSQPHERKPFTPSHDFRLHDIHNFYQFAGSQLAQAVVRDQRITLADFELSAVAGGV